MLGQTFAALLLAASAQGAPHASRLPPRADPSAAPAPVRVPIDLGPDTPTATPPATIDLLAPPQPEAANAALIKDCEDQRERGIVDGEIVVCGALQVDTSQLYSGSRAAWLKDYAERTQNVGTIAPPDVAGAGIFRGPPTISGLCLIGPCPKDAALIIDVVAIPPAPAGSDAARVAQGLPPVEADTAPLSDEDRRRMEAELGLPAAAEPAPGS